MNEEKLRDYFMGTLAAQELAEDLRDSQKKTSYDVTTVYVDSMKSGEFAVTKQHLILLCDDVISGNIPLTDLNTIGFALIASDYFTWDNIPGDEETITQVISDWDSPEIGYDLTIKNVRLWKEYLLTGRYRLDKHELTLKFRSKGKHMVLYQTIDEILWSEWDPIGGVPRDEYQGYTPSILRLVLNGADKNKIANKLFEIETKTLGMPGNIDNCRRIAEKIINLKLDL